ncbi:holin [Lactonifactor longoviformis]|uniref:Toxin secretion/phage lysis holin n=1 Tax=Lactonifactor longoviformis DSM 17459 TaxID=1122155 RepID=A0A1M4VXL6_9CLOT|nr:phage holin family protein [Lactonifactor longoviformis]POP34792.1 holin [Lactonifactor longoviformis]SHE73645.1 toxin secretion/phage lysis holin [Lactonifactor longoviformis DSM 17459]
MKVIDSYNAVAGAAAAVLVRVFGEHWILFAAFLLLNIADWITGWMKSRIAHKENSISGWKGVLKKLGYWLMILVAFVASAVFIEVGSILQINLHVTTLLGWFVLASLLVNEIRSICENFIEAGYKVPMILQNGLEVADQAVNKEKENVASEDKK